MSSPQHNSNDETNTKTTKKRKQRKKTNRKMQAMNRFLQGLAQQIPSASATNLYNDEVLLRKFLESGINALPPDSTLRQLLTSEEYGLDVWLKVMKEEIHKRLVGKEEDTVPHKDDEMKDTKIGDGQKNNGDDRRNRQKKKKKRKQRESDDTDDNDHKNVEVTGTTMEVPQVPKKQKRTTKQRQRRHHHLFTVFSSEQYDSLLNDTVNIENDDIRMTKLMLLDMTEYATPQLHVSLRNQQRGEKKCDNNEARTILQSYRNALLTAPYTVEMKDYAIPFLEALRVDEVNNINTSKNNNKNLDDITTKFHLLRQFLSCSCMKLPITSSAATNNNNYNDKINDNNNNIQPPVCGIGKVFGQYLSLALQYPIVYVKSISSNKSSQESSSSDDEDDSDSDANNISHTAEKEGGKINRNQAMHRVYVDFSTTLGLLLSSPPYTLLSTAMEVMKHTSSSSSTTTKTNTTMSTTLAVAEAAQIIRDVLTTTKRRSDARDYEKSPRRKKRQQGRNGVSNRDAVDAVPRIITAALAHSGVVSETAVPSEQLEPDMYKRLEWIRLWAEKAVLTAPLRESTVDAAVETSDEEDMVVVRDEKVSFEDSSDEKEEEEEEEYIGVGARDSEQEAEEWQGDSLGHDESGDKNRPLFVLDNRPIFSSAVDYEDEQNITNEYGRHDTVENKEEFGDEKKLGSDGEVRDDNSRDSSSDSLDEREKGQMKLVQNANDGTVDPGQSNGKGLNGSFEKQDNNDDKKEFSAKEAAQSATKDGGGNAEEVRRSGGPVKKRLGGTPKRLGRMEDSAAKSSNVEDEGKDIHTTEDSMPAADQFGDGGSDGSKQGIHKTEERDATCNIHVSPEQNKDKRTTNSTNKEKRRSKSKKRGHAIKRTLNKLSGQTDLEVVPEENHDCSDSGVATQNRRHDRPRRPRAGSVCTTDVLFDTGGTLLRRSARVRAGSISSTGSSDAKGKPRRSHRVRAESVSSTGGSDTEGTPIRRSTRLARMNRDSLSSVAEESVIE